MKLRLKLWPSLRDEACLWITIEALPDLLFQDSLAHERHQQFFRFWPCLVRKPLDFADTDCSIFSCKIYGANLVLRSLFKQRFIHRGTHVRINPNLSLPHIITQNDTHVCSAVRGRGILVGDG